MMGSGVDEPVVVYKKGTRGWDKSTEKYERGRFARNPHIMIILDMVLEDEIFDDKTEWAQASAAVLIVLPFLSPDMKPNPETVPQEYVPERCLCYFLDF